jgi:hypothetical protein
MRDPRADERIGSPAVVSGHRLLLYETTEAFVEGAARFALEGRSAGVPVLAAVTGERAGWLRDRLGGEAERLEFLDADPLYERHGPMLHGLLNRVRATCPVPCM